MYLAVFKGQYKKRRCEGGFKKNAFLGTLKRHFTYKQSMERIVRFAQKNVQLHKE